MDEPTHIRNLGPVSRQWLERVGICTIQDLRRLGSVPAYALVCQSESRATFNLLWALEAALRNIDWRELTPSDKEVLKKKLAKLVERGNHR